ncbi:MAG: PAS domain-containing protein [Desulfobacterales bacterium]|jgi:PAS domain S-box-containing protein
MNPDHMKSSGNSLGRVSGPGNSKAGASRKNRLPDLALEATSDGLWMWHIPSGEAHFSPRYYTMLGYEPNELPAGYSTWLSLLHPDDLDKTRRIIQRHIEDHSERFEVEFRLRQKSGQYLWILGRGRVFEWSDDGRPLRMVGSHVNIDKRKRAEQELAQYRAHLEQMIRERTAELEQTSSLLEATFNAIPDILGVQDGRHRIIRYNAAGYRFLGMSHDEVEGKKCFELIGRTRECDRCATSECYRTKKPASAKRYEKTLDAWLDVRAYPILDENGELVKVIEHLRDITPEKRSEEEKLKLQKQLQHAQKIESLGVLAGGIAHDFNNLLMAIQGRISLMAMGMAPSSPLQEHIQSIEECILGATDLTRQLLGFARGGKYEVKPIDLNELLINCASMFGRTKKEIRIHRKLTERPLTVEADNRQIEQVLLNLFINSWQAMPDGGELYLQTDAVTLNKSDAKPHQIRPGRYAKVSVTDTGIGMDSSILNRIFDPFFSTKEKGRGTGLGLASAYGIIKNHEGAITVYSEVGHGSTFNIYLPLSDAPVRSDAVADAKIDRGSETVLIVDDEEIIIEVGRALLETLGYTVIAARSGQEAIDTVKSRGKEIDLVILDLIMPGIKGEKAFEAIREIHPSLPILLSSGYAINGQATEILKKGCNGFIQKPYTISELSKKLRTIFNKKASGNPTRPRPEEKPL